MVNIRKLEFGLWESADIAPADLTNLSGHTMNCRGEVVNNAMELVEAQPEQLVGVLPKDYTIFSDDLLAELLHIFNNNALDEVGVDVIGRIYEYFHNKFAKNIAQEDGVFFTLKSLVKMIVNVLEPQGSVLLDIKALNLIQYNDSLQGCAKGCSLGAYSETIAFCVVYASASPRLIRKIRV